MTFTMITGRSILPRDDDVVKLLVAGVFAGISLGVFWGLMIEYVPGPPYFYYVVLARDLPAICLLTVVGALVKEQKLNQKMLSYLMPFSFTMIPSYYWAYVLYLITS